MVRCCSGSVLTPRRKPRSAAKVNFRWTAIGVVLCGLIGGRSALGQADGEYDCRGEGSLNPPAWIPPTAPGRLHLSVTTQTVNGAKWRTNAKHPERVDFNYQVNDRVFSVELPNLTVYAVNPDGSGNDFLVLHCGAEATHSVDELGDSLR